MCLQKQSGKTSPVPGVGADRDLHGICLWWGSPEASLAWFPWERLHPVLGAVVGQEEAAPGCGVSAVPQRVPVAQPRRALWGIVRVILPSCPARGPGAGVPIHRRPSAPGCFEALGCLHGTATWPPASGQSPRGEGALPVLVGAGGSWWSKWE